MIARLQGVIAWLLSMSIVVSGVIAIYSGRWLCVFATPAVLAAMYASFMAYEFAVSWNSFERGDRTKPRLSQLTRAWAMELLYSPRVFLWRQPFRSRAEADHLPITAARRRGVLLVHGFFCNRGIWNPWMRRIRASGIPFVAITLEPVFGSIDSYAEQIEAALDRLEQATDLPPVVVAHSMGGLAARACVAGTTTRRLHRLVTIATPHAGTRMAARGSGTNIRQMHVESDWLRALDARESPKFRKRVICFWSHCDNIVMPARNATLPGADNRHLDATPHVQMVDHPAVFAAVLELLGPNAAG